MAHSISKDLFPSQVVSDLEKISMEYGLKVGQAIESEWLDTESGSNRFKSNETSYHRLRLYARGEQSIQKYKDELSINGDLSYLNLDWKPVPIIPKFVDIVVNGISERTFDIKAYSQDPYGVSKRTEYMQGILDDMKLKNFDDFFRQNFNINLSSTPEDELPDSKEELELHMQLSYKQNIELAEEQAINVLLDKNKYDSIRKRVNYDLTVIGIGAVKNTFSKSEGVKIEYVDPANLVYSYTESPEFEDIYYIGEVKTIPINELKKQFPELTNEDLEEIRKQPHSKKHGYSRTNLNDNNSDSNQIEVLYFN